jgi:hypothetical protein
MRGAHAQKNRGKFWLPDIGPGNLRYRWHEPVDWGDEAGGLRSLRAV